MLVAARSSCPTGPTVGRLRRYGCEELEASIGRELRVAETPKKAVSLPELAVQFIDLPKTCQVS